MVVYLGATGLRDYNRGRRGNGSTGLEGISMVVQRSSPGPIVGGNFFIYLRRDFLGHMVIIYSGILMTRNRCSQMAKGVRKDSHFGTFYDGKGCWHTGLIRSYLPFSGTHRKTLVKTPRASSPEYSCRRSGDVLRPLVPKFSMIHIRALRLCLKLASRSVGGRCAGRGRHACMVTYLPGLPLHSQTSDTRKGRATRWECVMEMYALCSLQ